MRRTNGEVGGGGVRELHSTLNMVLTSGVGLCTENRSTVWGCDLGGDIERGSGN